MRKERFRQILATILLGVFVSLSITLTTHIFSEEHVKHICSDNATETDHNSSGNSSACILSQFLAHSFDGVVYTPLIGHIYLEVVKLNDRRPSHIIDQKYRVTSLRAPPTLG